MCVRALAAHNKAIYCGHDLYNAEPKKLNSTATRKGSKSNLRSKKKRNKFIIGGIYISCIPRIMCAYILYTRDFFYI